MEDLRWRASEEAAIADLRSRAQVAIHGEESEASASVEVWNRSGACSPRSLHAGKRTSRGQSGTSTPASPRVRGRRLAHDATTSEVNTPTSSRMSSARRLQPSAPIMRFTGQICIGNVADESKMAGPTLVVGEAAEEAEHGRDVHIEVTDPTMWASARIPTPPWDIPKVVDKQRLDYQTTPEIREARLINGACRKRLGELLRPSGPRLEAAERHASHGYEIVPPQNVRII